MGTMAKQLNSCCCSISDDYTSCYYTIHNTRLHYHTINHYHHNSSQGCYNLCSSMGAMASQLNYNDYHHHHYYPNPSEAHHNRHHHYFLRSMGRLATMVYY